MCSIPKYMDTLYKESEYISRCLFIKSIYIQWVYRARKKGSFPTNGYPCEHARSTYMYTRVCIHVTMQTKREEMKLP